MTATLVLFYGGLVKNNLQPEHEFGACQLRVDESALFVLKSLTK